MAGPSQVLDPCEFICGTAALASESLPKSIAALERDLASCNAIPPRLTNPSIVSIFPRLLLFYQLDPKDHLTLFFHLTQLTNAHVGSAWSLPCCQPQRGPPCYGSPLVLLILCCCLLELWRLEAPRRIPVSHVSSLFPQFRHLPVAGNIVLVRSLPDWRWRCRFPRFCVSPCFLSDSWSQTPVVDVYLFLFILFYCRGTVVCIR